MIWKRSRRLTSLVSTDFSSPADGEVSLLDLIVDVFRRAPAEGRDAERGVLIRVARKGRGVGDEKVFAIPRLAVLVENRSLGIVAHLGGPHLMDDFTAARDAPVAVSPRAVCHPAAGGDDDLLKGFLHVFGLQDLVVATLEMEAQQDRKSVV